LLEQHVHPSEAKKPTKNDNQSWKFLRESPGSKLQTQQEAKITKNRRSISWRSRMVGSVGFHRWVEINGPHIRQGLLAEKKQVPPRSKHHVSTETASVKQALTELWDMMKHTK